MPESYKAWGVSYHPGIKRTYDYECEGCSWNWTFERTWNELVGYSPEQPFVTARVVAIAGIVIIECPRCFEKFWFHIDKNKIETYRDLCPNWPKD